MQSNPEKSKPGRERHDWGIVLLILLIGFLCVILSAQWALRFAPSWQLDADMESNVDLNSEFLTSQPIGYFEPVDPAILTQPVWVNVFLTPGAEFVTGTPPSPPAKSTPTELPTIVMGTNTIAFTSTTVPTNTLVWLPLPPTATRKPTRTSVADTSVPPADTPTSPPPPPPSADLQIAMTSSAAWYAPGTPFTYTIVVSNILPGSSDVTGVTVADIFPAQVSLPGTTWSCSPTGGASCTNGTGNLSDTVNLPFGSSITYTVNVTFNAGTSGPLTNQASVSGASYTEVNAADNISPVLTALPGIDLQIVKSGPGTYTPPSIGFTYTVTVTNLSSFTLNGVTVRDIFSGQLGNVTWGCALCPSSGTGNINDTINLSPGAVVTYNISGDIHAEARGPLVNMAEVIAPAGFIEISPGDEQMTITSSGPNGGPGGGINIGGQDGSWDTLGPPFPTSLTMAITPIFADGTGNYDFVYYERIAFGTTVELDWVEIRISLDGSTWMTVFNWGNGSSDDNTNVALPVGLCGLSEDDNCGIDTTDLHNSTGIAINIDAIPGVSSGSYYPWIQIISPANPNGDGADVDAIQPYYP